MVGGSAKSDFMLKAAFDLGEGVKIVPKSSDVIYRQPLTNTVLAPTGTLLNSAAPIKLV